MNSLYQATVLTNGVVYGYEFVVAVAHTCYKLDGIGKGNTLVKGAKTVEGDGVTGACMPALGGRSHCSGLDQRRWASSN